MCPQWKRVAVATIWTLSAVLSSVALGISLSTVQVNFYPPPLLTSHPYTLPVRDFGSSALLHCGTCCGGASLLSDHPGMLLPALLGHACRTALHQESVCDPDPPGSSDHPLFSSFGHGKLPDPWLPAQ